ncbi:siderophore-interacting protein [Kocuria sp.]|uniref:siderophore-interacting protein n=1 Tax=Kocuria sp. TaxID=1871328 RepID=UPI00281232A2|nr:siderophore-interacting protein [Kocuria sp.]HST71935.1 siderophore-interacting protein [Kocuria rosea]
MTALRSAGTTPAADPVLCVEAAVTSVTRLCPSFRRITLAGPELASLSPALIGEGGPARCRDAYVKLLVPPPGRAPERADLSRGLREGWFARPAEERGWMRTYTVRGVHRTTFCGAVVPELVLDVVVHGGHGQDGPGSRWARTVAPGERVYLLGPGPQERPWAAWDHGGARRVVAVGDETAAPALMSVAEEFADQVGDSAPATGGARPRLDVVLEVPHAGDVEVHRLPAERPGVRLHVLPRAGRGPAAGHGHRAAVRLAGLLGLPGTAVDDVLAGRRPERGLPALALAEDPAEPRAWSVATPARGDVPYVFLAGESGTVKALRRLCVDAAGIPKDHVSFMGYWRQGQAES